VDNVESSFSKQSGLRDLEFLWLEITEKCNLECRHCYVDSGPHRDLFGTMKTDDWFTIIKDSANFGCRQIQFIGGEPTLHPDLPQMIALTSAEGYTFVELFTNATTISNRLLEVFVRNRVHIAVSFYSDEPTTHDSITRRKGSFDRTVAGLTRMIGAGLTVRAGIIEMKQNSGHALRAKRFLENLGVMQTSTDFQRPVGRGLNSACSTDPMAALCGECWRGKLCVTSTGTVFPCVFSRFAEVGNVKRGIREILEGESLKRFRVSLINYASDKSRGAQYEIPCEPLCSPPGRFCLPSSPLKCMPSSPPPSGLKYF
jgi:MoaA/NifB/PqqE/SkfB family radical SAM enzyme